MKLKIIVKIIEKLFGVVSDDENPRADLYLPDRLLAMSLVFLAIGISFGIYSVFRYSYWAVGAAIFGVGLGIFAFLCWKNQRIHMISDDEFTYTTMFGNTRTYSFYDIEKLRYNKDSLTLFVAGDKVHMEDMAIISDRLEKAIKRALTPGYKYLKFTAEELEKLPDEELFIAVWARVDDVVMQKESIAEGIGVLNEAQRLFYSLSYFESDVNLEGLSGFFEDSISIAAPFIGEYLGTVGAVEHRQLYEDFIKNNKINTELFSSLDREEEIESHLEGCPFEDYDNAYLRLSPIRDYLHDYIRENIDQF